MKQEVLREREPERGGGGSRRPWPCIVLLVLTIANVLWPDPLPIVDEALLAGLTALCFGKHRRRGAGT